jgi:hypothetical protein
MILNQPHFGYLMAIATLLLAWLSHSIGMRGQYVAELARILEKYVLSLNQKAIETVRLRTWLHYFKDKAQPGSLMAQLGDRAIEGKEDPPGVTIGGYESPAPAGSQRLPIGVPRMREPAHEQPRPRE